MPVWGGLIAFNLTANEAHEAAGRVFAQRMVEPPGRYRAAHGRGPGPGVETGKPSAPKAGISR